MFVVRAFRADGMLRIAALALALPSTSTWNGSPLARTETELQEENRRTAGTKRKEAAHRRTDFVVERVILGGAGLGGQCTGLERERKAGRDRLANTRAFRLRIFVWVSSLIGRRENKGAERGKGAWRCSSRPSSCG